MAMLMNLQNSGVQLRYVFFAILLSSVAQGQAGTSYVQYLQELKEGSYGIRGLSHVTISGAKQDGNKEVEVWVETAAPGAGTPIHRHDCEEVFLILKGGGTFYIAPTSEKNFPGEPIAIPFSFNSSITIPNNAVHQVINTGNEDMHFVVSISKPPMKSYIYKDWNTPHDEAFLIDPLPWDKEYESVSSKDEL